MEWNGAEIICRLLEAQGVETIAGIPGGANLPLYDALAKSNIRHVLARHEQGAGFIAQGMARVSGRAGVCFGTSGPGATNLLTAIADAKLDSVPLVAITGQVATPMIGTDAFQEVDTFGLSLPITKHNFAVRRPEELLDIMPLAFEIAESGRPGPVLIDVPKDVQTAMAEVDELPAMQRRQQPMPPARPDLDRLAEMIARAERPILYIGGGIITSGASELVRILAERADMPVTSTLMGLGAFPADEPRYLGMLGMHGNRSTHIALDEADLLVAVGVRFDDRATGKVAEFCKHAEIAHIDIDNAEIDKIKKTNLSIVGDAATVLREALPLIKQRERPDWLGRIAELKAAYPGPAPKDYSAADPLGMIEMLAEWLPEDAIITTDVGQHQMWMAQAYPFRKPRTFLTSGGLGTMGFGFPAAIGAALASPDRPVICISGDGSFLMNNQELSTLAELGLNVKTIIMNNRHLGLVRQQQELFYGERYTASQLETTPDFAAMARAFHVEGLDLAQAADPEEALREAISRPGPVIIDAPIPETDKVFPMVPPGAANRDALEEEPAPAGAR